MIGAVGGSLMNLVYPYFLDAKGWRGPQYRRVQMYDFLLGMVAMLVLNLAVWVLGAELLFPGQADRTPGRPAEPVELDARRSRAVCCSTPASSRRSTRRSSATPPASARSAPTRGCGGRARRSRARTDFSRHPCYRWIALSTLVTPLIWTLPGMPGFVALTLTANAAQVILLPMLAGGLWWITASERLIGREHRNRWWENALMATLFGLATYFGVQAVKNVFNQI